MSTIADRVRETTTTTGTGTISLGGPVTGFQTFSSAFPTGTIVDYCITDGVNWEVGSGTLTTGAPSTLSRTTVYNSSNSNSLVNFSAGTKDIFCSLSAAAAVTVSTLKNGTLPVIASDVGMSQINKTVHTSTTIIRSMIYDTSKDSDGGAWRQRCSNTSWYRETIYGTWLGEAATEAAARAIPNEAPTNSYYHNTTDGKFYALSAGTGQVEVFRGNSRIFPAKALVIIEADRVIIYDATSSSLPMWMVIRSLGGTYWTTFYMLCKSGSSALSSAAALNGTLYVTNNDIYADGGLYSINFITDECIVLTNSSAYMGKWKGDISTRHVLTTGGYCGGPGTAGVTHPYGGILNSVALDVDVTLLPNSPIDSATGLPTALIAVATSSGCTVINNGVFTSLTHTGATYQNTYSVLFSKDNSQLFIQGVNSAGTIAANYSTLEVPMSVVLTGTAALLSYASSNGYRIDAATTIATCDSKNRVLAVSHSSGMVLAQGARRSAVFGNGLGIYRTDTLQAFINNSYNTGWQPGDTRGTWLSDTTAETVVGTNLITGDSADFTGLTLGNWVEAPFWGTAQGASFSAATGALVITSAPILSTSSVVWTAGVITVVTTVPHLLTTGKHTVLSGFTPIAYNVVGNVTVIDATTFTLPLAADPGAATVLGTVSGYSGVDLSVSGLVVGQSYCVQFSTTNTSVNSPIYVGTTPGNFSYYNGTGPVGTSTPLVYFTATATTLGIRVLNTYTNAVGTPQTLDNISLVVVAGDRSLKNVGMHIAGTLTKSAVNTGSQLMAYSGFSATNYLEREYSSSMDFGTGQLFVKVWIKVSAKSGIQEIVCRDSVVTGVRWTLDVNASGYLTATCSDGVTTTFITGNRDMSDGNWHFVVMTYTPGVISMYINGKVYASTGATALTTLNNASALLRVGIDCQGVDPAVSTSIALLCVSATIPSVDQIYYMYVTERKLFESGAQCCIAGTSASVSNLISDVDTDLLHVGTSYGRSVFNGLKRVDAIPTTIGVPKYYDASGGTILESGSTKATVYIPNSVLREELLRVSEQKRGFGQELVPHTFTSTANQATYTLPVGFTPKMVYIDGLIKQLTTHYSYVYDGFKCTITLTAGVAVNTVVTVLATMNTLVL